MSPHKSSSRSKRILAKFAEILGAMLRIVAVLNGLFDLFEHLFALFGRWLK